MDLSRLVLLWLVLVAFFVSAPAFAQVSDGEIVVLEQGGYGFPAALIGIDPVTGTQTVLSSGALLAPGMPCGFAYDAARGMFWVVDRAGNLIEVNASTGSQSLVDQLGSAKWSVAVESDGNLLVADTNNGNLARIDPTTLSVSTLAQGGFLSNGSYVELDSTGAPIVSTFGGSNVVRVDPVTGAQTLIAHLDSAQCLRDFAVQGDTAFIATFSTDAEVDKLDLTTGQFTTYFCGFSSGLLDVDLDSQGRMVILDQSGLAGRRAPVVYRSSSSGGLDVLSTSGHMFAPSQLLIIASSSPPAPPTTSGDRQRRPRRWTVWPGGRRRLSRAAWAPNWLRSCRCCCGSAVGGGASRRKRIQSV